MKKNKQTNNFEHMKVSRDTPEEYKTFLIIIIMLVILKSILLLSYIKYI